MRMSKALTPTRLPIFLTSTMSFLGMSLKHALGVSSLQYAGRHFEMPTQEQLNSPTIHFSSSDGVPSGEARMKSVVHHSGIGSSGMPRAGMILSRSVVRKFLVRFANLGSSGP